tara:strand:- start:368 stop:691 length:324 start_codon:yes stop_codon:yes gene_type:complete
MRVFILAPICLLFLAGCSYNKELKNNQELQRDDDVNLSLPKDLDGMDVEKKINEIKNKVNEINIEKSTLKLKSNNRLKTPLDELDECLASKKEEGLPIYECTNLLKP